MLVSRFYIYLFIYFYLFLLWKVTLDLAKDHQVNAEAIGCHCDARIQYAEFEMSARDSPV